MGREPPKPFNVEQVGTAIPSHPINYICRDCIRIIDMYQQARTDDSRQWMDENETKCKYNLAETCCASISLDDLCALSEDKNASAGSLVLASTKLTYGEIPGTKQLRENLSRLYSSKVGTPLSPDSIVITNGAIAANHLVFYSLLTEGDHVICHYPTYQQLYSVPESLGAKVDLWRSKEENGWLPDFAELEAMVTEETKLIILKYAHLPSPRQESLSLIAHFPATLKTPPAQSSPKTSSPKSSP